VKRDGARPNPFGHADIHQILLFPLCATDLRKEIAMAHVTGACDQAYQAYFIFLPNPKIGLFEDLFLLGVSFENHKLDEIINGNVIFGC
jgi:hypothetical protein